MPIGDWIEPTSFECIDFQRLSQIIANLTREKSSGTRSGDSESILDTDGERQCASHKQMWTKRSAGKKSRTVAVTDEDGHPWRTNMKLEEDYLNIEDPSSKSASRAQCITNMKISCGMFRKILTISVGLFDRTEFDDLIASKKDSAPGPDGIP